MPRLRFSIRTMLILVTLACIYLACWRLTATSGVADVIKRIYGNDSVQIDDLDLNPWTPIPMVVRVDEMYPTGVSGIEIVRRYYFWYFFGAVRVPFQREDPPAPAVG